MTHTLPAADHACSHKRRALRRSESGLDDGVAVEEVAELGNKLFQLPENEE